MVALMRCAIYCARNTKRLSCPADSSRCRNTFASDSVAKSRSSPPDLNGWERLWIRFKQREQSARIKVVNSNAGNAGALARLRRGLNLHPRRSLDGGFRAARSMRARAPALPAERLSTHEAESQTDSHNASTLILRRPTPYAILGGFYRASFCSHKQIEEFNDQYVYA